MGKGVTLGVSHAPPQGGGAPALPNFGSNHILIRTPFDAEVGQNNQI